MVALGISTYFAARPQCRYTSASYCLNLCSFETMTRLFGLSSLFFTFLRKLLFLWVRTDVINGSARELGLDPAQPVVYVLQHSALSSRLVLEQECRRLGLPSAQQPLTIGGEHLRRSFFFL